MRWRGWFAFVGIGAVAGLAYRGYWWWAAGAAVVVLVPVVVWVRGAFVDAGAVLRDMPAVGRHRQSGPAGKHKQ